MKLVRILIALFALTLSLPAQTPKKEMGKKEAASKIIDVNSADAATLKTIPGIGTAYAEKIIAHRPYKGKDEIVTKAGVPQATYDKIKDQIIAKQSSLKK